MRYYKSNIYGLGDIVAGPPTAQNAKQQGYYLANYFNNDFKGEPYEYKEKGKIIHSKDWIIIDTNGYGTWKLPHFIQPIIDYYISRDDWEIFIIFLFLAVPILVSDKGYSVASTFLDWLYFVLYL